MKKYVGVLANTLLTINNIRLSDEAIKHLLVNQTSVPVTVSFGGTAIGRTTNIFISDDNVIGCEFELDESKVDLLEQSYVVPGLDNVKFHYEGQVIVIDSGDLVEASITLVPANPLLSPIKLKE